MFISSLTMSVQATTGATNKAQNSTAYINGVLRSVYIKASSACGANEKVHIFNGGSTTVVNARVFGMVNPSTLGSWFFPLKNAVDTTNVALGSSEGVPAAFANDGLRCVVTSSSADKPLITVTAYIEGVVIG